MVFKSADIRPVRVRGFCRGEEAVLMGAGSVQRRLNGRRADGYLTVDALSESR